MENYELIEEAYGIAENSSGSALRENEKYMKSIQGHLNQMSVKAEKFWFYLIDSNLVKNVVDMGSGFMDILTAITTITDKIPILNKFADGGVTSLAEALGLAAGLTNKLGGDKMYSPTLV